MTSPMTRRRFMELAASSGALLAMPGSAMAEGWPERAITGVNGYNAGGGSDFVARNLAEPWGTALGQPINIVNRVGAVCSVACDFVWNKPSDGYWWLMCTNYNRFLRPTGYLGPDRVPWKEWQWFRAASTIMSFSALPDSPIRSFDDLIRMAKAKPGELRVGNSGAGGVFHLGMALVEKTADIKVHHVAYQGDKTAILAGLQGEVDVIAVDFSATLPLIKDGKLRNLCVFTPEPYKVGDQTYQSITEFVPTAKLHAPYGGGLTPSVKRDTDSAILKKLETAFWKAHEDEAYLQKLRQRGIEPTPRAGKDAQRDCALAEVVTAVLMHDLGLAKAHPHEDLKLPQIEDFDEWWAKQEA